VAGTATADEFHECNPENDINDECTENQRCQDDDADGAWSCACIEGYEVVNQNDGFCALNVCPMKGDSEGEYKTIDGKCYYFHTTKNPFTEAVADCKTKFEGDGRLFEPRTKKISNKVATFARAMKSGPFWIGVRKQAQSEEKEFYYLTEGPTGEKIINSGWEGGIIGEDHCTVILNDNELGWATAECNMMAFSICEVNQEDTVPCGKPEYATDNFCDDENNHEDCHWDGGACCNNPLDTWNSYCDTKEGCKCKDPHAREAPTGPNPTNPTDTKCEDTGNKKKCKKCAGKGNACTKDESCEKECRKTCKICK